MSPEELFARSCVEHVPERDAADRADESLHGRLDEDPVRRNQSEQGSASTEGAE